MNTDEAKAARIAAVRAARQGSLTPAQEAMAREHDEFMDAANNPGPMNGPEDYWISGRPPVKPGSTPAA